MTCNFRITVTEAPPPFVITDANGEAFSTADKNINSGLIDLDLSDHVQLPYNRIVIIQDVANNVGNQGTAAYTISTECGGVAALPPIAISPGGSGIYTTSGGQTVATLVTGRFTVHSPTFANFGSGAAYPAVATSTTSDRVGGCSVTASVAGRGPRLLTVRVEPPHPDLDDRQPAAELRLRVRLLLRRVAAADADHATDATTVDRRLVGYVHRRR